MREIYVVWCDGCDDEYFSTREKAKARCIDIITEALIDDRGEMYECLLELEEYDSADGLCGFYGAPIDEYDEVEAEENIKKAVKIEEKKENKPRGMKYHIYNRLRGYEPLTAEGRALEFDNEESALRFILSVKDNTDFDLLGAYVMEDILYYDGGYLDATNLIINKDGDLEEVE
jgi:hypothetical protein